MTGKNYSMYLNAELVERFDRLQKHLGYGVSQTIANLIEVRDNEIKDGMTRRQLIGDIRDELAEIKEMLGIIIEMIEEPEHVQ